MDGYEDQAEYEDYLDDEGGRVMNAEDKDAVMGLLLSAHNRANEVEATEAQATILDTISFVEVL